MRSSRLLGPTVPASAATAAIGIADPLPLPGYATPDLLITVTRGSRKILVKDVDLPVGGRDRPAAGVSRPR